MFKDVACPVCVHVPLRLQTPCFNDCRPDDASAAMRVGKTSSPPVIQV